MKFKELSKITTTNYVKGIAYYTLKAIWLYYYMDYYVKAPVRCQVE